ncbi:hypothetical protein QN277_009194 [Acacia crassicarpa]|uniref:F-box domain-containing protein n=1 Tax=Acacia crassicarpa TaxID=499986 RepID=A0AAE1IRR3_9FABA|nr:hypothetical protein QN277_009194 [Acacia crassicarpa]
MEQTVMENEVSYLPPGIIRNILLRLSVKSLIRFQRVCKDWKNLFKTPSFIADHLHRSTQKSPLLVVDSIICRSNPWRLCLLNREMQALEFQNTHITNSFTSSRVYSSYGLLCVELIGRYQHSFWLWNPCIRKLIQVPKPLDRGKYSVGFGFSPIVNDYKIVQLCMSDDLVDQVEVYALREGLWRAVELRDLEGVSVSGRSAVTCNGAIFWFGLKEGEEEEDCELVIVSFDIAMEVFTLIPFPNIPLTLESCFDRLTMYQNKLAMLAPTVVGNPESYLIDLWVLEESTDPSKERWSWTKLYTSRPNPYRFSISPIVWRNEIVCSLNSSKPENHEAKVVFCNITTDEFKVFTIPKCGNSSQMFDYVESLVLLDRIEV